MFPEGSVGRSFCYHSNTDHQKNKITRADLKMKNQQKKSISQLTRHHGKIQSIKGNA